ncbi:hypothetical protein IKF73_02625 [Candidatus Saccharibacteria bacterium]|nr:hypothetical protein [Candidatus Saccharibacteria bacterium]
MAREINLVPDIKGDMIKTLKLRNLIFFLCIIVAAVSVGAIFILGVIAGGQRLAIDSKKTTIDNLSAKLDSYSDLNDFLTIKTQLSNLDSTINNKKVLSRTFNILSAIIPTGADKITISELGVDLSSDTPFFAFEAQANAGQPPYIDYSVLDSFKKSMKYMRYDYGTYVDKDGNTIPAYCMIETNTDGAFFIDPDKGRYAYWNINSEGCNPATANADTVSDTSSNSTNTPSATNTNTSSSTASTDSAATTYATEDYSGTQVVKIWRTPQPEWYKENPSTTEPSMTLDGVISNVPHFESACITYSGQVKADKTVKWEENNDTCLLVPGGDNGIVTPESSNGRDASGELVLRFAATINLDPKVYDFNNTHMIALSPSGYYNVTDSYVQIQAMFGERAKDCAKDDAACNSKGEN